MKTKQQRKWKMHVCVCAMYVRWSLTHSEFTEETPSNASKTSQHFFLRSCCKITYKAHIHCQHTHTKTKAMNNKASRKYKATIVYALDPQWSGCSSSISLMSMLPSSSSSSSSSSVESRSLASRDTGSRSLTSRDIGYWYMCRSRTLWTWAEKESERGESKGDRERQRQREAYVIHC